MRYSILFVFLLILLSGFIAYFGDLLGRKMGKKRLSLFKMRPRYTAVVFTICTGMIISAMALGALVAANSQFRKVLTEWDIIFSQMTSLKKEVSSLDKQNSFLKQKGKSLVLEVKEEGKAAAAARLEAAKLLKAKNEAQKNIQRLQSQIDIKKTELESLKRSQRITREKLDESTAQLNQIRTALAKEQAKLLETERKLNALSSSAIDLRAGRLVLRQGDELCRGPIKTNQSLSNIKFDLQALLNRASEKALQLGVAAPGNGRAVTAIMRRSYKEGFDIFSRNEALALTKAAENIIQARPNDQIVAQIVCARNTLQNEKVPVEISLNINSIVFTKGQLISTTRIDGTQTEGRILIELTSFLQSDVAMTALHAGVIPVMASYQRSDNDQNKVEQIEALMSAVNRITEIHGPVRVEVYADEDIRSEGPLDMENMRIEITRLR